MGNASKWVQLPVCKWNNRNCFKPWKSYLQPMMIHITCNSKIKFGRSCLFPSFHIIYALHVQFFITHRYCSVTSSRRQVTFLYIYFFGSCLLHSSTTSALFSYFRFHLLFIYSWPVEIISPLNFHNLSS